MVIVVYNTVFFAPEDCLAQILWLNAVLVAWLKESKVMVGCSKNARLRSTEAGVPSIAGLASQRSLVALPRCGGALWLVGEPYRVR